MIKADQLEPLLILEWIKGDKQGEQEIIKDVDTNGEFTWVNFESGGRINGHVINEYMILLGIAEESDVNKHLEQKEKQETEIPTPSPINTPIKKEQPKPKNTFGFDILDKAKRDSRMSLDIKINLDFISDEKLSMLLELYGEELFISLKDYIRQQLSEELIDSCIEQYLTRKFPNLDQVNKEETVLEVDLDNPQENE